MSDKTFTAEVGTYVVSPPISLKTIEQRLFHPDKLEFSLLNDDGSVAISMTSNNLSRQDALHLKSFLDSIYRIAYSDGFAKCFTSKQ